MFYNARFSTGGPEFHLFDTSLMIILLEYLVLSEGSDVFACRSTGRYTRIDKNAIVYVSTSDWALRNNDADVRTCLRRIKEIMNVIQHNKSQRISNEDFQKYWEDISWVIIYF